MDGDTVMGNIAHANGGGLLVNSNRLSLINLALADNQADGNGSGLFIDQGSIDISQATIANNIGRNGIFFNLSHRP